MCPRSKKSSKTIRAKSKMMSKIIGLGSPKEAVPLVMLLRDKKKAGEDVAAAVTACVAALGG
jgi:hypothetical protein